MNSQTVSPRTQVVALGVFLALALAGCSSTPEELKPIPLSAPAKALDAPLAWRAQVGPGGSPLSPAVASGKVFVASSNGTVAALDSSNGKELWRVKLKNSIGAGVGTDGKTAAVVTRENELVAMGESGERWRVRLPAKSSTAPLVAGGRVFVLMTDRSVSAFDASNGAKLWTQSRPSEPLVLEQSGVLMAVGDTLVAGLSARMTGLDPLTGAVRWQALMASSRGTNEVERLVDLVGTVSRVGDHLCARAFNTAIGCVEAGQGTPVWNKPAAGVHGLAGDEGQVFGVESDGKVIAWKRSNGDVAWQIDRFKNRSLTSPLAIGRVVVFGDSEGMVHVIAKADGKDMARLATDGSAIVGAPVILDQMLVVQTAKGGVFAWRPR